MRDSSGRIGRVMRLAWVAAGCVVVAVAGCGRDGPERTPVVGRVTYRSEPVKTGEIRFLPIKDTKTPMWGASIVGGQYAADGNGGVPVGVHKVEIIAWREKAVASQSSANLPPGLHVGKAPQEQYLPAKYNSQSELEITIEPGSGKIVRDFALTD